MSTTRRMVPGRDGRRGRGLLFGATWLVFLASPVSDALHQNPSWPARTMIITVTVAFCLLYVGLLATGMRESPRIGLGILAGLVVLSVVFCVLAESGIFTFVYIAAAGTMVLSPRLAAIWVGLLVGLTVVLPLLVPGWEVDTSATLAVLLSAVAGFGFVQLLRRNWELRQAQDQIARLAVADERVRFSRDLHDILGHSLTVITVKAELAGRLVGRDPERAEQEINDVERLAREALADVRSTAAGYRSSGLAAEISQARRSLEAAGINAVLPNSVDEVTGLRREVFGWVVREGVTNVVRHSRARTCSVRLTPTSVEVLDDGMGTGPADQAGYVDPVLAAMGPAGQSGHGLVGLRERVHAAGGTLAAGSLPDGGFRLYAQVPESADVRPDDRVREVSA
ncbi:MAG TPA: sensor histidine kinase [Actinopolymorphaceae bacterium]|nr:sensor histidine kinase [Actinopolymorphaceae bacterium]